MHPQEAGWFLYGLVAGPLIVSVVWICVLLFIKRTRLMTTTWRVSSLLVLLLNSIALGVATLALPMLLDFFLLGQALLVLTVSVRFTNLREIERRAGMFLASAWLLAFFPWYMIYRALMP